jgi:hypothetical protein
MNEYLVDAEIGGIGRVVEVAPNVDEADRAVWREAGEVLRERAYGTARVIADWPERASTDTIRVPLRMDGEDVAELFLHDAFLLFNLAVPGSFGGTIALTNGHELTLDTRLFEYAWATAPSSIGVLPLRDVAAWYESADEASMKALFHLLHLSRSPEDEVLAVVRLAQAAAALGVGEPKLFALRDALVRDDAPVSHPLDEDEAESLERIDVADRAASAVVAALQQRIRK